MSGSSAEGEGERGRDGNPRSAAPPGEPPSSSKGEGSRNRQEAASLRPIASRSSSVPRDLETDRALRRRVLSGLPKARKYVDPNQIEIFLPADFLSESIQSSIRFEHPLTGGNASGQRTAEVQTPGSMTAALQVSALPNPVSILGSGRVDPFAAYPIHLTATDRWILDQLFTSPDPAMGTFRESWLPISANDPAMFHQLLASVTWRLRRLRGEEPENVISIAHHSLAIRAVNSRLSDPEFIKSDYSVSSVAMLVCYSIVTDDYAGFDAHIEGLQRLIQIRGGFKVIEKSKSLPRILFGVDVSGGYRHDQPPRFPFPEKFLLDYRGDVSHETLSSQGSSRLSSPSRTPWERILPTAHPLNNIFDDILDAISHARRKTLRDEIWIKVHFATFWIDPISYKLLKMKADVDTTDSWSIIAEATRLGIILFFGEIRRKCGALAVTTLLQMKKLKALMVSVGDNADWTNARPLLLWVIFFGFLESLQEAEHGWYLRTLAKLAQHMNLGSWNDVTMAVREFVWINPIHDARLGKFRQCFDLELSRLKDQCPSDSTSPSLGEWSEILDSI